MISSEPLPGQVKQTKAPRRRRGVRFEPPYAWIALLMLLVAWELACDVFGVSSFLLPPPSAIAKDIGLHWQFFLPHIAATSIEVLIGFAISIVVAIPLAIVLAFSRVLNRALYPLIVGTQVVPKVAVAPLMLAWFGFGMAPKVGIIVTVAFFPVVINAVVGLRSVSPQMILLARSIGASPLQTFCCFRLPQALPNVFAGIKMASVLAVIGAVVAEFVGADSGLGYVILTASSTFDVTRQFSAILLLSALGMGFFWSIEWLERLLIPWHRSGRLE